MKLKEIATITIGRKDRDNHLNQWDILLHNVKKQVVIVANPKEKYNVNGFTFIIRLKYDENIQQNSINLYMYLKSHKGQIILDNIASQKAIKRIKKIDLEVIDIPYNQIEQSVDNFAKEKELYGELSQIAHTFDDFNTKLCAMCKKPAKRWHQDTWFPFDNTKGRYLCNNCQIMF